MIFKVVLGLMAGWMIMSPGTAQQSILQPKTNATAIAVPAPASLTATRTANGVRLTWRDDSNGKAAFKIERKSGDREPYQEIASAGPGKTAFEDLTGAGKTCRYRIRAFVGAGKTIRYSAYSNEAVLSAAAPVRLNPVISKAGLLMPAKVLTIPAVIDAQGTLTVTGGQPAAGPTTVLAIPAVINPPGTLTVTGGAAKAATAVLTIPITVNPTITLTVTGKNPE